MKKNILVIILGLFIAQIAYARTELLDRVVAIVNDDVITQSEVDTMLRPLYEQHMRDYSGETAMKMLSDAQQKLLSQLIEDRLVLQEAVKKKIEVNDEDIDREIRFFKQKFGSQAELEKALKTENASLADLKSRLKKQALIRKLHEGEVRSKVIISPKELESYYAEHVSEFSNSEQVRVRSLTIKKSDDSRAQGLEDEHAKKRLLDLQARLLKGEDFEKIVKENSEDKYADQGGVGKWIKRGDMIPSVDEVIFKTEPLKITEMIETPIGYHLFKVVEKQAASQKTFEQSRDQIYEILFRKKSEDRFTAWMKELKKKSFISVNGRKI